MRPDSKRHKKDKITALCHYFMILLCNIYMYVGIYYEVIYKKYFMLQ